MNIYLQILIAVGLLILLSMLILRWKFPRAWFVVQFHVFRNHNVAKEQAKTELKLSKKNRYATFEEFLKDCPKYQIADDLLGRMIRGIMTSVGVEFQQFVFIRKNDTTDKTAWLRKEDKKFIHEGGTYLMPGLSSKNIIYYDRDDCRPLIDLAEDIDWRNPDMCSDVVTGLTNSKDMLGLDGEVKQTPQYIIILIGLSALAALLIGWHIYTSGIDNQTQVSIMNEILNQVKPPQP